MDYKTLFMTFLQIFSANETILIQFKTMYDSF
jgi:hypothetical protein